MKNKNILITGGAGFVGSALAEKLYKNNNIYVLDNHFTGSKKNHIKGAKYYLNETKDVLKIFKNTDLVKKLNAY